MLTASGLEKGLENWIESEHFFNVLKPSFFLSYGHMFKNTNNEGVVNNKRKQQTKMPGFTH